MVLLLSNKSNRKQAIKVSKYHIRYAFDYSFSALGARSLGSHEIMAAVKFGDNARRYRWLNRY